MHPGSVSDASCNFIRGGTASMKRSLLTIAAAALLVASISHPGTASGPFDQKLSPDQQIIQALNRLTFGPRPGDVDEVRRVGVSKWIELQLHPDRIPENPALEARLKPLESLRLDVAEIVKQYTPQQNTGMMLMQVQQPLNMLLSQEELRK